MERSTSVPSRYLACMHQAILIRMHILCLVCFSAVQCTGQHIIHKEDRYGLIDSTGTYLLPVEYDDIRELLVFDAFRTRIYQYKKDNKYGLYNSGSNENTGAVLDTVFRGPGGGTYLLGAGNAWGFLIEPEMYTYSWVMPKYKEVIAQSDGFNPFSPDPYMFDYQSKGFCVRNEALWGYASYYEDKLLIPMEYENPIEKLDRAAGDLFVSINRKKGGGYIIHPKTLAVIQVADAIMGDQLGDYFVDSYWVNDSMRVRTYHLPTGRKIIDVDAKSFERMNISFRMITSTILEFGGEAKRKKPNVEEDYLHIWYDLNTGEEILRQKTIFCRELTTGGEDAPTEVWSVVTCGGGNSKLIGHLVNGKFVKD